MSSQPQRFNFEHAPDDARVRSKDIRTSLLSISESTLWKGVKSGRYPQPIPRTEGNATFWRLGDWREYLASQGGAK